MTSSDVVQSHLEVLMERLLATEELLVDPDGSIGVEHESAVWFARVRERGEHPHLEVFSVAVDGVDADPGLYEALNEVNRRVSHCRVFHTGSQVVVAGELVGESATLPDLVCLAQEVADTAHVHGRRLAAVFGGCVGRPDWVDDEEDSR